MTYLVVDQRPNQKNESAEVDGRTYPVPSVVEDEDGLRLVLLRQYWISVDLWVWALQHGVVALINIDTMKYALASTFSEERTENERMRSFVLAESFWRPYTSGMSYMEMTGTNALSGTADLLEPDLGEFVHLHTHSEFSALDGVTKLAEMMEIISEDGQKAIAVTDHGNCAAHPALQIAADKAGIRPIFGMEANFVDDRHRKDPEVRRTYQHLVLWAMNDLGLRNLWAMSTEGYQEDSHYDRPRIDWDILERYAEGVMASTACLRGPVLRPYLEGDEAQAVANLGRLQAIFGDRLYVELHVNHLPEQLRANEWLVPLARARGVPLVAVVDSHYGRACDQHTHRVWLSVQTDSDVADDNGMFGGGQDYHLMTVAEVRNQLSYLDHSVVEESIRNTVRVAARCNAKIEAKSHKPVYSNSTEEWPDPIAHDVDRLFEVCLDRWDERIPADRNQGEYLARFEREMSLLVPKTFCGYFLMVADFVNWAKDNGILVGPGRGSGGGSLVAYLCRITEVDPVEHELLFERFMTEGREELPDFDIDFPSSQKSRMFDYVRERWGEDNVAIVGTHLRMKSKGILNDIFRALKSTLPEDYYIDSRKVAEIIDEAEASSAGLGMPWEDLWAQHGDQLQPYRDRYPEVFGYADVLYGRLKTFGTHPAGIIISTDGPVTGALPLRRGGEGAPMVAQFDMEALDALGYPKFDLLNLRTLDTLQMCVDLIKETTGEWIDVYSWKHDQQYADPTIFEEISAGWTLGVFQIETQSGTRLTTRFGPSSVRELADVITLVRPGPMRSGLTETYFKRRCGDEEVRVPDSRLESVLAKTFGTMLYQEDIMQTCMVLAGYSSNEADYVRKILGKKKVEAARVEGEKFRTRAVENGTDPQVAQLLWEQMEEFSRYAFNRAHAFAYAILGVWTAWFKFHYPVQFLCASLSTVKQERIAEFVEEARRMGYSIQPPDINESSGGFTASQMAVRYGFLSIKGIGDSACEAILAGQPFASWEDFLERKTSKCNSGHVKLLVQIGAFDSLVPNRRGLEHRMEAAAVPGSEGCVWRLPEPQPVTGLVLLDGAPETQMLPCSYDWPAEPREPSKQAGRFKKAKPLPKRCSRACRRFEPQPLPEVNSIAPYTDEDIRQIELETLGVFLSSTPFDRIAEEDREVCSTAVEVLSAEMGEYIVPGLIRTVRITIDRHDRTMAFVKLATERGELEVTVFSGAFARYRQSLVPGRLVFAVVKKNSRGQTLELLEDLDTA